MDPLIKAGRRHAAPMLTPASGLPLIKSVPSLGRRVEVRRGRSTVPSAMAPVDKKRKVYEDLHIFIQWMAKEDKARFHKVLAIEGPFPHLEVKPNDVQHGDKGGQREVARSLAADTSNPEYEDYILVCEFDAPEYINEIPADLAAELFAKGRPGLRPLREREWKQEGTSWSPRS
jgi:hypothetical protein